MEDYELVLTDTDRRPITALERAFQDFEKRSAESIAEEQKYEAIMKKKKVTESAISKARTSNRTALLNLQASAQRLFTRADLDDFPLYRKQAEEAMIKSGETLHRLDTTGGSRRKRNKSRNKVYSAHKKSKRRRVKSTRRRHKKSTMHHRRKY